MSGNKPSDLDVSGPTAELGARGLLQFIDETRRDAAAYMTAMPQPNGKEPLEQAYERRLRTLSDVERAEFVLLIEKMADNMP